MENEKPISLIIAWVVAIALFMETLDSTIISVAIPSMANSFHVSPIALKFALTSYLLTLAVFIPISGWVADRFGSKKIFMLALFVFTASSIACGLSNYLWELVLARVMQGLGGALMMPVGRLIIYSTFPKHQLVKASSYFTIPALLGPILGPTVGGVITTFSSWHWIFYINIPFGIAAILLASKYIKSRQITAPPFDTIGFFLFGLGLMAVSIAFDALGEQFISLNIILIALTIGAVFLIFYFWHCQYVTIPAFDIELFRDRTFGICALGSIWSRLGVSCSFFLLPLMLQLGFGLKPITSGLLMMPLAIGLMIAKFPLHRIISHFRFRKILTINPMLIGATIIGFSFIDRSTPYIILITLIFLNGFFLSIHFSSMNILSYVDLDAHQISRGTSIISTIIQIASSFSIGLSALLLKTYSAFNHVTLNQPAPYHIAFFIMGLITFTSFIIFTKLEEGVGSAALISK